MICSASKQHQQQTWSGASLIARSTRSHSWHSSRDGVECAGGARSQTTLVESVPWSQGRERAITSRRGLHSGNRGARGGGELTKSAIRGTAASADSSHTADTNMFVRPRAATKITRQLTAWWSPGRSWRWSRVHRGSGRNQKSACEFRSHPLVRLRIISPKYLTSHPTAPRVHRTMPSRHYNYSR